MPARRKNKKKRKRSGWSGPLAARRKAVMSSFMKNMWAGLPRNPSDELLAAANAVPPGQLEIHGYGDYQFSKRGNHSIGARAGAWVGDRLQNLVGRITGLGDYTVSRNSLVSEGNPLPSVHNSGKAFVMRHQEYLGDVITSATPGAFTLQSYHIQPADPVSFPWLAQIANLFQEYEMNGMLYQFRSMSADALNSTNTALGQVIMSTQYNPALADFSSKYEMENTEFTTSCKPSTSMLHPIECARNESVLTKLYIAPNGVVPPGEAVQFYDFANFQIATNGFQAASVNIGELWVTYDIAFYKPVINSSVTTGATIPFSQWASTGPAIADWDPARIFGAPYAPALVDDAGGVTVSWPDTGVATTCLVTGLDADTEYQYRFSWNCPTTTTTAVLAPSITCTNGGAAGTNPVIVAARGPAVITTGSVANQPRVLCSGTVTTGDQSGVINFFVNSGTYPTGPAFGPDFSFLISKVK